jgi:hypothetical protein
MTISTCPIATVQAPLERVWAILGTPEGYGAWWDARTERVVPPGPLAVGQTVIATAGALGLRLRITTRVEAIDPASHMLALHTTFPLGISVANHITCQALDAERCRVSFG